MADGYRPALGYAAQPARRWALCILAAGLAACSSPPDQLALSDAADSTAADSAADDASSTDGNTEMPDLTVNAELTQISLAIEERMFQPDACELLPEEGCALAAGLRRLLRFSIETPNIGTADLFMGRPTSDSPLFEWSECHGHFHYEGYAGYELRDSAGQVVVTGRKQAFCLVDTRPVDLDDPTVSDQPAYTCQYQGIQRGWSDIYQSDLPCQFIDITGIADGDYTLRLTVNSEETIAELDFSNNIIELPISIGALELTGPDEACPDVDPFSGQRISRECGWERAGEWECTPGQTVRLGCADACDLGSCTGDPLLRVCASDRSDGNCSHPAALSTNTGACGSDCPRTGAIICPPNGRLDAYTAPKIPGQPYTCTLEMQVL